MSKYSQDENAAVPTIVSQALLMFIPQTKATHHPKAFQCPWHVLCIFLKSCSCQAFVEAGNTLPTLGWWVGIGDWRWRLQIKGNRSLASLVPTSLHSLVERPGSESVSHSILSTFCDPMGCSLPGSSVHRILQARILKRVAISFFRGIFLTQGSNPGLLHCRQILYGLRQQGSL